jgi:hypothetical protein
MTIAQRLAHLIADPTDVPADQTARRTVSILVIATTDRNVRQCVLKQNRHQRRLRDAQPPGHVGQHSDLIRRQSER